VLPFDTDAAVQYARIARRRDEAGRPIGGFDAQIAAICRAHGAALATGNIEDFLEAGVEVIDPWRSG
jgi:predicted nucleic acid-binding protein